MIISDENYIWHTETARGYMADIFTLKLEDPGNTDGTSYKYVWDLKKGFLNVEIPDTNRPVSAADSITNQSNRAYGNQIATMIDKPCSF